MIYCCVKKSNYYNKYDNDFLCFRCNNEENTLHYYKKNYSNNVNFSIKIDIPIYIPIIFHSTYIKYKLSNELIKIKTEYIDETIPNDENNPLFNLL